MWVLCRTVLAFPIAICVMLTFFIVLVLETRRSAPRWVESRMAMAVALLCGLLVGERAQATEARIERPHWVIIATVIDLRTGQPLDQGKLEGRELEFDDPVKCQSVVDNIRPIATDRVTAVLTCSRVGPAEETL